MDIIRCYKILCSQQTRNAHLKCLRPSNIYLNDDYATFVPSGPREEVDTSDIHN